MAASALVFAGCSTPSGRPPVCTAEPPSLAAAAELELVHGLSETGECREACSYYRYVDALSAYCLAVNEVYHGADSETRWPWTWWR